MADLTTKDRKALPTNAFAVPSKAPGSGSYPIPDKAHARNALARASGKPVQGQVDAAVHRKFPSLGTPDKRVAPHGVPRPAGLGERQLDGSRSMTMSQPAPKKSSMAQRDPAPHRSSGGSGMEAAMGSLADKLHPRRH